jgi:two-component system sensor histidine kinase CpxA
MEVGDPENRMARVFYVGRGGEPKRYWAAAMVSLASRQHRHPPEAVVAASSASLGGNEIFFDWRPWLWAIVAVLLVSALIWLPFVSGVSRRLRRLTSAAESISEGRFKVEVASTRSDELGRLSRAVQSMANRLGDYMAGQKRFLGDIAHELCSPLARLRMALGVLENKIPEKEHGDLDSLNEEAEELSQLVNELLDFSRASIAPQALPLHEIEVAELLREVAQREGGGTELAIEVPPGLRLTTNRDLLRRALANVVRNAIRYAGGAGPISLLARAEGDETVIQVNDRGPGIPEAWIEKIFEPFSRPERARTREGGGAGLGLAIAKTCVEGLRGRIRAWNRVEGGLAVEIAIRAKLNDGER